MSPQEKKVAQYHRQWERQTNTSVWLALAIVTIAVVGLGVFLTVASGSGGRAPAIHFGKVSADQHAPNTPTPAGDTQNFPTR
jgi:hypothetical protein